MTEIRFKNFIPKDEDLRRLWQEGVSVSGYRHALEKELDAAASKARQVTASKTPLKPQWDLKRIYSSRSKKLVIQTNNAIAQLNGKTDIEMDAQEEEFEEVRILESAQKLSFIQHVEELSDDEDEGFLDARRFTGSISKHDLTNNEFDE